MADISAIKVKPGDKFYHWTVRQTHTAQKIDCVCDCGYEKQQRQTDLLRGVTRQCPSCYARKPKADIFVGKQFGKWTVLDVIDYLYVYDKSGALKERRYKCGCECGTVKYVRTSHITRGLSKQCDKCRLQSYYTNKVGCIPMMDIQRYKAGAHKRKKEWAVEPQYLYELYEQQNRLCAISGMLIEFSEKGVGTVGAKDISTASLDRIDSSKGYIVGNVQWVHKIINIMKMDLPERDFFRMVKEIYEHKRLNKQ